MKSLQEISDLQKDQETRLNEIEKDLNILMSTSEKMLIELKKIKTAKVVGKLEFEKGGSK